jgi:hypothetical protein
MRFLLARLLLVAGVLAWMPSLPAQEAKAPTLTTEQKLQLQLAVKDVELAQLRLKVLITALTPPGYQITDALELAKVPEAKP